MGNLTYSKISPGELGKLLRSKISPGELGKVAKQDLAHLLRAFSPNINTMQRQQHEFDASGGSGEEVTRENNLGQGIIRFPGLGFRIGT